MPFNLVRGAVDSLANSRGRSLRHLALGLGLTAGAVALSAVVARLNAPAPDNYEVYSDYEELEPPPSKPPPRVFAMVWAPLLMALTLSGLRIWNAPASAARTQALTLWGAVQALNAVWMALGPKRLGGQVASAVASLGTAGAYVWRASRVDPPAASMVAPYVGWIGFANVLSEELWHRNSEARTLH